MSSQHQAQHQGQQRAQANPSGSNPPSRRGSNDGGDGPPRRYSGAALNRSITRIIEFGVLEKGFDVTKRAVFKVPSHHDPSHQQDSSHQAIRLPSDGWSQHMGIPHHVYDFQKRELWVLYAACCDCRIKELRAAGKTAKQIWASIATDTLGVNMSTLAQTDRDKTMKHSFQDKGYHVTVNFIATIRERAEGHGPRVMDDPVMVYRVDSVGTSRVL